MTIYQGNFENWKDVKSNFNMEEAEPEQVFFAAYDCEDYEGYAIVAYRNGNDYFLIESSHCSCMGLEDTWNPEKYDKETFFKVLEMRKCYVTSIQELIDSTIKNYRDQV